MKKEKQKYSFSNFGFSTILLTFITLCIMTFGVLSLVTANSDLKLSKKVAEKSNGYHQAEEQSYIYLTQIEDILIDSYEENSLPDNYYSLVTEKLDALPDIAHELVYESSDENVDEISGNGIYTISWEIAITDTQYLAIELVLTNPEEISSDGYYKIKSWKTIHKVEEDVFIDDSWNLMGS